jgi:Ca2+-binding EF-hand superfamily protein
MTIDIEKLIKEIDEDGSGRIEYEEFRNLLANSE